MPAGLDLFYKMVPIGLLDTIKCPAVQKVKK